MLTIGVVAARSFNLGDDDWRQDWAVAQGFSLEVDTEGFHFPSAIAFVREPGPDAKDPLYFVTELRGKVKVVTNDRTVYTFAEDFFKLTPNEELPSTEGQGGLAGICLEPKYGYVFATFAYQDSNGVLRNSVVRFQSKPETFSLQPTAKKDLREIFSTFESGLAHQIGACQIQDDLLYLGIGDGGQPMQALQLEALLGKIVRMTLDGDPVPDNPFYTDDGVSEPLDYVWAYGLRNPFSLKVINDRVFVADNGHNIDRFLRVTRGGNYFWNGNDWSIATNALFVFVPSHAPTQLDFNPRNASVFPPQYEDHFFVGTAGVVKEPGPAPLAKTKGILSFKFDFEENRLLNVPKFLLKYQGDGYQAMVGLAFGPDGLYFAPLFAGGAGTNSIYKLAYDPDNEHPFTLDESTDPLAMMNNYGCLGCHTINNRGGSEGPALDREPLIERIHERLNSKEYKHSIAAIDKIDAEPYSSLRDARDEVARAKDLSQVKVWLKYHLLQPKFDNRHSKMPYFGFTEEQAIILAEHLLGVSRAKERSFKERIAGVLPSPLRYRYLFYSFAGGMFLTILILPLLKFIRTAKDEKLVSESSENGIHGNRLKRRLPS